MTRPEFNNRFSTEHMSRFRLYELMTLAPADRNSFKIQHRPRRLRFIDNSNDFFIESTLIISLNIFMIRVLKSSNARNTTNESGTTVAAIFTLAILLLLVFLFLFSISINNHDSFVSPFVVCLTIPPLISSVQQQWWRCSSTI